MGPPQSAFSQQQQQQQQRPNLYNQQQQQQVQAPINSNIPYSNMADTRPGLLFFFLGRKNSAVNVQQLKLRERKIFFFRLISVE